MTLLPGITPVKVTGTVADNKGVPATGGTVTFRMPYPLADGTNHVLLLPGSWTFTISGSGGIDTTAQPMPAATISGVSPAGWAYNITVHATRPDGTTWYRAFWAVIDADASFEQLVSASLPAPNPGTAYVPLSAVGDTVAPLVAGKVPSQFLPPGGGGSGIESVTASNGTIAVDNTDPLNPKLGVGTGIPQSAISGLGTALTTLTTDVASAASTANAAGTLASSAATAASNAQTTASAAYVKPGGGIPESDLSAAVQALLTEVGSAYQLPPGGVPQADLAAAVQALLTLAGTAQQLPTPDPAAARFNGHSCNVPLYVCRDVSTINGELWVAIVPVKKGVPINGAFTFRTNGTAANSSTGVNGFAVWDVPAGGGPGALLGNSVSDDLMWAPTGKIDKAVSGVPTPTADGLRAVGVSVRGYSDAPEFLFDNMAGAGGELLAQFFAKYKAGAMAAWPSTLDLAVDVGSGTGFILPVFLRS